MLIPLMVAFDEADKRSLPVGGRASSIVADPSTELGVQLVEVPAWATLT